jgi:16S rRNA (uracil1498-N3)-methyltransferase
MRPYRLFCPEISTGLVDLSRAESHHAVDVLRLAVGEAVELFDGAGHVGHGQIEAAARRKVSVRVHEVLRYPFEFRLRLTLAVAMPKAQRQAFLIEKCTELGVWEIWPITTARAVVRPSAAAGAKWSRWAGEACKQCRRSWVPRIATPASFADSLARSGSFDARCICHPQPDAPPIRRFLADRPAGTNVLVWIGPEGGWTDEELVQAQDAGVTSVRLAPTVLRTETAAMAVCASAADL